MYNIFVTIPIAFLKFYFYLKIFLLQLQFIFSIIVYEFQVSSTVVR